MNINSSPLLRFLEVVQLSRDVALTPISNISEFSSWSHDIRSLITQFGNHMHQLHQYRARQLSITLTNLHKLPPEIIIHILELVLSDVSIFHQSHVAVSLRLVCSAWNYIISNHAPFFRSLFLNTLRKPISTSFFLSFPIDLAWFISNTSQCDDQASYLHALCTSTVPIIIRSFHLLFNPNSLPTASTRVLHSLNFSIKQPSFQALTHLELINVSPLVQFPPLHLFSSLQSLVLKNSVFPFVHPTQPLTLRHLYLQNLPIHSYYSSQLPHAWLNLLSCAQQLETLRLDNVYYSGYFEDNPQPLLDFVSTKLVRLDISIMAQSSLDIFSNLVPICSSVLEHLNVFFSPSPIINSLVKTFFSHVCVFHLLMSDSSLITSLFLDPSFYQTSTS